MTVPTGRQVLQLYRDLLRYGQQLQFTDKDYFARRIRKEFKQAKNIESAEDINFYYQVSWGDEILNIGSETSAVTDGDLAKKSLWKIVWAEEDLWQLKNIGVTGSTPHYPKVG
ncbi:hypothetical protein Cfor_08457 [Coptotermes formosanus]|uniref:Complex 1 LYR protein domain-containing protein n=1 Tax=Coptotermes formosanus TaxID=36987 RepID=A0A6L2PEM9_COPFO|nr:hypothetical protein Cfor_08457 [Coptotermes formosanus]